MARRRVERLPSRNAAISSILSYNTVRINVEVSVPAVFTARQTPEGGSAATSFVQSCAAFQSMPRGNDEVSVPAVSMARRLVVRLPSRNAARLSSESCTAFQSMPRGNVEVSVPAVSMVRRLVVRLQGGQQCRHTTEIRSEVSRPPDLFRTASSRNRKVSSLLLSGFGRAGATANASGHFPRLFRSVSLDRHIHTPHHRPSSQVTLGSAQTRQGTLGSLDSPSAAASSTERRSALNRRRKPRPSRLPRLFRSGSLDRHIHTPHHRPSSQVTLGSAQTRQGTVGSLDSPSAAASSTERRSALKHRRKPRPSRRSAVISYFALTRNAPQRSSADHRRADRVA